VFATKICQGICCVRKKYVVRYIVLAGVSSVATPLLFLASLLLLHVRVMFLMLYFAVACVSSVPQTRSVARVPADVAWPR
jgi:hypothetical protein